MTLATTPSTSAAPMSSAGTRASHAPSQPRDGKASMMATPAPNEAAKNGPMANQMLKRF